MPSGRDADPRASAGRIRSKLMHTRVSEPQRAALTEHFLARELSQVNRILGSLPAPLANISMDIVCNARAAEAAPVWRVEADGRCRFRFHKKSWDQHPGEIVGRWLDTFPLIEAVLAARPVGSCVLNLGDEGHRPGLTFDGDGPRFTLIPDHCFIKTEGYASLARVFAERSRPWQERRPVAFWRGTTTGLEPCLQDLPRFKLCRAGLAMGSKADIGFASASQRFAGAEPELEAQGALRDFVPPERYDEYQLHIDIDGNTAPWTGFAKLHSGSPVLKVASPHGRRQWYYDRLVPWRNYVPIRSDLSDLPDIVGHLLDNPSTAERIGAAGRLLARSMSLEAELGRAVPVVLAAFQA